MLREVHRYTWTGTNRHEVRVYEAGDGRRFVLDRTLDGVPPFFHCREEVNSPRGRTICVDGQEYWGDGWDWEQAVAAVDRVITTPPIRRTLGQDM